MTKWNEFLTDVPYDALGIAVWQETQVQNERINIKEGLSCHSAQGKKPIEDKVQTFITKFSEWQRRAQRPQPAWWQAQGYNHRRQSNAPTHGDRRSSLATLLLYLTVTYPIPLHNCSGLLLLWRTESKFSLSTNQDIAFTACCTDYFYYIPIYKMP